MTLRWKWALAALVPSLLVPVAAFALQPCVGLTGELVTLERDPPAETEPSELVGAQVAESTGCALQVELADGSKLTLQKEGCR